jgi:hypothetical protein
MTGDHPPLSQSSFLRARRAQPVRAGHAVVVGLGGVGSQLRAFAVVLGVAVAVALGVGGLTSVTALAQGSNTWIWVDNQGRQVFSDVPPPASIPERNIRKRPSGLPGPAAGTAPAAAAEPAAGAGAAGAAGAPTAANAATPAVVDAGKAEAAAAAKAEAERAALEKRNAQIRADNCEQARRQLLAVESGARLSDVNERGETVVMDDAMRTQAAARQRAIIRDNCGPAAPARQ